MLSSSINTSNLSLHDDLFLNLETLFLKLAVRKGSNITIKNNIPELARIIFRNGQVKLGADLVPIVKVLIQIRDDGYDIGSVISVIGIAYNSAFEKSKPKFIEKIVLYFKNSLETLFRGGSK